MFAKKHEIEGVNHNFILRNEALYVLLKNGELLKFNVERKENVWASSIIENASKIGFLNEAVFSNTGFETKIITPSSGSIISQFAFKIVSTLQRTGCFLAASRENGKKLIKLINKDFVSLWEKDIKMGKTVHIDNDTLINTKYLNDQVIIGYDLESFEELWKVDIAEHAQFKDIRQELQDGLITHVLGIFRDTVWFGVSSGSLMGVNIKTGELEHPLSFKYNDLPKFPFEVKEGDYLPFGELMQLDEDKAEIIGLRDKYFIKVDLNQAEPRRKYMDVGQSMEAHKITSSYRNYEFPTDGQFIYFCDDRQGKIGVFDREKREVVWSYELEMQKGGIAQILEMKYADNRWYVLDRNDTLHIFERE